MGGKAQYKCQSLSAPWHVGNVVGRVIAYRLPVAERGQILVSDCISPSQPCPCYSPRPHSLPMAGPLFCRTDHGGADVPDDFFLIRQWLGILSILAQGDHQPWGTQHRPGAWAARSVLSTLLSFTHETPHQGLPNSKCACCLGTPAGDMMLWCSESI